MEKVIPVPGNWHWAITPEDVNGLKAVDRETVNRVYFANYEMFRRCAYNFCRNFNKLPYVEDCTQQVYLDLPLYDYTNSKTFFRGLLTTFYKCSFNRFFELSFFSVVGENENGEKTLLIDCLAVDVFKALEEAEDGERQALKIISAQTALTDNEKDFLTAVAFKCRPYRGLFNDEYRRLFVA